jgi:Fanconi-associated nuclease 1
VSFASSRSRVQLAGGCGPLILSFCEALLTGDVVRLSPSALRLFGRLSLVYHRTAYSSPSGGLSASSPLTMSLLARFGKRRYPKYLVSRSWALFGSRQTLREFEAAMQIEKALEECLDGVWGPGAPKRFEKETKQEKLARYRRGTEIWESIEGEWRRLCAEAEREMKIKEEQDEGGERRLYYRRRFHPGWPLSRAAYKAAACYAKLVSLRSVPGSSTRQCYQPASQCSCKWFRLCLQGDHDAEVSILRHLLSQTSFRRGKRGDWYDRLALVLMRYPLGDEARLLAKWGCKTEPSEEEGSSPKVEVELQGSKKEKKDAMLRARREEALALCEKGLADPYTHLSA